MTIPRLVLLLLFASILPAFAQAGGWSIQGGGWLGSTSERGNLPSLGGSSECGVEISGSGTGWGLEAGISTPPILSFVRVRLSLGYGAFDRALSGPAADSLAVRTDATTIATAAHSFSHSITGRSIEATAGIEARIWPPFITLGAGVGAQFHVATTISARDIIDPPSTLRFPDGRNESPLLDATPIELRPVVPFATVAVRAAVPVGARMSMIPWLSARMSLGSILNSYDWRATELGAGLGLELELGSSEPTPSLTASIQQEPIAIPIPAPILALRALDDDGNERDTATLDLRTRSMSIAAPMPAAIEFATGAAAFGPLEERDTTFESLLATTLDGARALPFIAHELAKGPRRVVTLTGSIGKEERTSLAARRARYVREALLALGAPSASVVVDSSRVLKGGPKVTLRSSAPVHLRATTTQEEHRYPRIVVECSEPLRDREISLSIGGRTMGRVSEVNGRARLGWSGADLATMNWTHLTAELPSRGDTPSAVTSIPIHVRRSALSLTDSVTSGGRRLIRLAVSMDLGDNIAAGDRLMVDAFLQRVPPKARVLSIETGAKSELPHTAEAIIGAVRGRDGAVVEAEVGG